MTEPEKPKPYRPSNGTEGEIFYSRWCDRCKHDDLGEDGTGEGCDILARSFAFPIDHQEYPKEWIEDAQGPRCTAFDEFCEADQDGEIPPRSTAVRMKSMADLKAYLASDEVNRGKHL